MLKHFGNMLVRFLDWQEKIGNSLKHGSLADKPPGIVCIKMPPVDGQEIWTYHHVKQQIVIFSQFPDFMLR